MKYFYRAKRVLKHQILSKRAWQIVWILALRLALLPWYYATSSLLVYFWLEYQFPVHRSQFPDLFSESRPLFGFPRAKGSKFAMLPQDWTTNTPWLDPRPDPAPFEGS